jgi:D-aspartate ligase
VNRRRLIVVLSSLVALAVAVIGVDGPAGIAVMVAFLFVVPGLGVLLGVDFEDPLLGTSVVVGTSLAIDVVVATALLYLSRFGGSQVVQVVAVIAIVGALWPRRAPRSTAAPATGPTRAPGVSFDRSVPALLPRIGRYPVYHGGVSAIRSLGRVGVPVYAVVEDGLTPAAVSRYLERPLRWPTTGAESADELLDGLRRVGERLDVPAVAIPSDDEAAVFLAEHRTQLGDWLITPRIAPDLPRRLASKRGLDALCREHGIATPATSFPETPEDIERFAESTQFPVVVKNVDPFQRLTDPAVGSTTIVLDRDALLRLAEAIDDPTGFMLQEYLPGDESEDWIFHTYCDESSKALVSFTGVKLRSWPAHAGVTTLARAVRNRKLESIATQFCRDLGYQGIADLDWRFDRRDRQYKLVDFNPRMGAQFALFSTAIGIDVVRAQHLDLTGREVPRSPQRSGEAIRIGHLDLAARFAYHGGLATAPVTAQHGSRPRGVWLATDDMAPVVAMSVRVAMMAVRRVAGRLLFWRQPRSATERARRGAAKSVPQTNRINGPKVAADDKPEK